MKLNKVLALVLCAAMLLSMCSFAGAEAADDWFADKDFSERVTISYASVQIDDTKNYYNSDEWCKWWGDKFNVEFEITSLTWDNWNENLRIWINAADMPDWCVWNYDHGDLANYVDQGLVKQLPDDWKTKFPNVAAAQDRCQLAGLDEELFGGTYVLVRPNYALNFPAEKVTDHISCYIRKDWAKAVGVEINSGDVITLPELYDLAAKLKEANPGNVEGDFYPITARTGYMSWLIQYNDAYSGVAATQKPYYIGEDGLYHWGGANETVGEALKMASDAYKAGLLHPEFYTMSDPDDVARFYSAGTSAITITEGMAYKMDEFATSMEKDLGLDFNEAVAVVAVAGADGLVHAQSSQNYWGANLFSPDIDDEVLERILYMMDYSASVEGQEKIHYGIEGEDYVKNEDGTITRTLDLSVDLWDKYAMLPVYVNMIVLSDDFQFENPAYSAENRAVCKALHEARAKNSTEESFPSVVDWTPILHSSMAVTMASMVYEDEYANLIVAEGDVMENWQKWVDEKMNLIQPVLDELNAKIAK